MLKPRVKEVHRCVPLKLSVRTLKRMKSWLAESCFEVVSSSSHAIEAPKGGRKMIMKGISNEFNGYRVEHVEWYFIAKPGRRRKFLLEAQLLLHLSHRADMIDPDSCLYTKSLPSEEDIGRIVGVRKQRWGRF